MWKFFVLSLLVAAIAVQGGNSYLDDDDSNASGVTMQQFESVEMVTQNYEKSINTLLVDQIKRELEASYIYQAYASYFQRADVNLPGIQKFFTKASAEEKQHAQMLIDYVNKRGGHATFHDVNMMNTCKAVLTSTDKYFTKEKSKTNMCICNFLAPKPIKNNCPSRHKWKQGLMAFQDTLAIERFVNHKLLSLHKEADDMNDAHLAHVLEHDFLDEQVNAINELGHFVSRLSSFNGDSYSLGEYMFDQKL